ncbi:MAG: CTAG/PCC1 family protein [Candidatus Thermoplasmatota archaeon]|jgi:tRNA threonylcarbamoyladenosine modification (KEOPS) complex  Pcc1 subunit|nr:CTAG/PCC1 family protein [Candidatus Thermoplasmatota archaeon]MCL5441598.1 CTAG/PCC1 family protein [Candidatus Thermoplasmatota archaeon]
MYRVKIRVNDPEFSRYLSTMQPEQGDQVGRGKMTFVSNEDSYIYIEAPDSVSLRASVSSLTRWLIMIEKILKEVK